MKTTVSFDADDAEDLQRVLAFVKRLGAPGVIATAEKPDAPTVYDEIWAMLSEQTNDQFEVLSADETDQQFFRRLVAGIDEFPSANLSAAADAWFNSVVEVPAGKDIAAPPGFYNNCAVESSITEVVEAPRDRLAEYRKARAATKETIGEPALAKPKQKRGRKPNVAKTDVADTANGRQPVAAPAEVPAEPDPKPEPVVEPIEEIRARLLAIARVRGIDWARLILSANGVAKFGELSDADARAIVRASEVDAAA